MAMEKITDYEIVKEQQKELKDLLRIADINQADLARMLNMTDQRVSNNLNVNKSMSTWFYTTVFRIAKEEIKKKGLPFPAHHEETPDKDDIEAKALIKAIEYLTGRVQVLEKELEHKDKEIQVLRVQSTQITDAGKRLKQGNR